MRKSKTTKSKRNPTDITLRNLRSLKKQIDDLNRCMAINVESLNTRLVKLETKRGRR